MLTITSFAQAGFAGSGEFLGGLIGISVIFVIYTAWKFVINARNVEQGMRKRRSTDARSARHEAALWQGRCADLEYLLRTRGVPIPELSSELRAYVSSTPAEQSLMAMPWDQQPPATPGEGQ